MKIVGVDNFDREHVADILLLEGIPNALPDREKAEEFCSWINSFRADSGSYHYRVVEDDYRLSRGMEDLV